MICPAFMAAPDEPDDIAINNPLSVFKLLMIIFSTFAWIVSRNSP
jgi:hypothetical protein